MRYLFFFTIVLSFTSCQKSDSKSDSSVDSSLNKDYKEICEFNFDTIKIDTFQRADLESSNKIAEIDSIIESITDSDSMFAKARKFIQIHEADTLIEVSDFDDTPEDFFASYSIIKEGDRTVFISESPYSISGDWYWIQRYYFDNKGNIMAFSILYSSFDERIEGGLVVEELKCYFDDYGNQIKRKYKLTDKTGKEIDFKKHEIVPTFYDAVSIKNLTILLKQKPFLNK